jgi:hypothetical protein
MADSLKAISETERIEVVVQGFNWESWKQSGGWWYNLTS